MAEPNSNRIVFVHSSDELYGADRILLELLEAVSADTSVEVWLPSDVEHPANPLCVRLEHSGYLVRHLDLPIMRRAYRTPLGLVRLLLRARQLLAELRKVRPRIVYCTTSAALLGAPIARLADVPIVVGHVQEIWTSEDRKLLGPSALFCHQLVSISEAVRQSLPRRLHARTRLLPNATPDPGPVPDLTNHTGELVFVVASRWTARKGLRTLLRAWELANSPGRLLILGGPPPTGSGVDVTRLVNELNQPESVTIVGEVSDVSPYLIDADVVLVPSDLPEGFGLVAIEAFARARPVVASAHGGMLEVVTSEVDGWLFPPGDSVELAKLLRNLTRVEASAAGKHGRQTFESRFTAGRLSQDWNAIMSRSASL